MVQGKVVLREKGIGYTPDTTSIFAVPVNGDLILTPESVCFEWSEGLLKKTARAIEIPFADIQVHAGMARISASKPASPGSSYPLTIATTTREEVFYFSPDKKRQLGQWFEALHEAVTGAKVEFDSRDIGDLKIGSRIKDAIGSAKPITAELADVASPLVDLAAPVLGSNQGGFGGRASVVSSLIGAGIEVVKQVQTKQGAQVAQDGGTMQGAEAPGVGGAGASGAAVAEIPGGSVAEAAVAVATDAPGTNATVASPAPTASAAALGSIDEQVEAVKKLKELLDVGVLTQEEFDAKKKQIMGL